jgi:glycosyltransferase involved in cell wall biosynthesis
MNERPRVTAMVGTLNYAHLLPRAIDSLLRQTIEDIEVLVVDDGSTDDTEAVVTAIEDPRVRYLKLDHIGIARSLNRGLEEARADVIVVQDADDVSLPARLERQLEVLEARPEVAVVGCLMREVDDDGRELRRRLPIATGDVREALMRFNPIPNTAAAFRRDAVQAIGGYDPRYRLAVDYDLWIRMSERHVVVNLDEELALRRMGTDNLGQSSEREMLREMIHLRMRALRRRRTLRGVTGLARPLLSLALPLAFKRRLRRARGQAPV